MNDLTGQVALVSGAGRGIGRAIAEHLALAGVAVVVTARTASELEATVTASKAVGGTATAMVADATKSEQVQAVVEQTVQEFGHLDLLVNNVGQLTAVGPVWEVDPEVWWRDIEVNLRSVHLFAHHALKPMIKRGQGRIINLAGGGETYVSAYGVSKKAVSVLTKILHQEASQHGVKVFELYPGPVDTALSQQFMSMPEAKRYMGEMLEQLPKMQVSSSKAAERVLEVARGQHDEQAGQLLRV